HIVDYARSQPLDAILPIGDTPVLTAALANQALHLQHHSPRAAAASRNKFLMRQLLCDAGLRVPWFACFPMQAYPRTLQHEVLYPCVLKPLALSASRGVMRANPPEEFVKAFWRLRALLETPAIRLQHDEVHDAILVEKFLPRFEEALEALLTGAHMQHLVLLSHT